MKKIVFIISNIIVCACMLFSCGRAMENKKQEQVQDLSPAQEVAMADSIQLEDTFEADTLNPEQLDLFQLRAQEKLQDFINYIEIISKKSYNVQLRLEASKQIKELLADTTTLINIPINKTQKNTQTLSMFLNDVYQSEYDSIKIKTDSVIVALPKKAEGSELYVGDIHLKINVAGYKNRKLLFNSSSVHEVKTIVRKSKKVFGKDTEMVWTVLLGELK